MSLQPPDWAWARRIGLVTPEDEAMMALRAAAAHVATIDALNALDEGDGA